ncbi:class I SAM-dependent methyltransferase [Magnetococcales bacterium HHB-1]
MMEIDFVTQLHTKTARNYVQRVVDHDKAKCAIKAKAWDKDYWDGDRRFGYGGYRYDGRWRVVAEAMAKHYNLQPGARILDVGCGKGYLLYEFTKVIPDCQIVGIDISSYAIAHAKEEVKPFLQEGLAQNLPFKDDAFDFVVSITTLHNLYIHDLWSAVAEIERVGKGKAKHITVESYRNEQEKANLLYWQLTCEAFYTPTEWQWIFDQVGYQGDFGVITFE